MKWYFGARAPAEIWAEEPQMQVWAKREQKVVTPRIQSLSSIDETSDPWKVVESRTGEDTICEVQDCLQKYHFMTQLFNR